MDDNKSPVNTRPVTKADAEAIVALDAEVTGEDKAGYWSDILDRFTAADQRKHQCFLVATAAENEVVGFIVGEIWLGAGDERLPGATGTGHWSDATE